MGYRLQEVPLRQVLTSVGIQRSVRHSLAIISILAVSCAAGQVAEHPASPPRISPEPVDRETAPPDATKQPLLRAFTRDEWRMWTGPFRRASYSSHTVKKYVIPFALISGALIATDTKTADALPNTLDQAKWSGRVSQIGAFYSLAAVSGATYLIGQMTGDNHGREAGWLGLEALAHTELVVLGVKQITNRERPLEHGGRGGFWQGGDSFPSGHAATSFAVATIFAREYRDHIAVPIAAYTLASAVAASRMSARRHWMSDIVVGGSMGFLIGRYVYKRHHDPNLPGSSVSRTSRLIPEFGFGGRGLVLAWRL